VNISVKHRILKIIIRMALGLHTLVYKFVTRYVVSLENGLHPKHRITDYHRFFMDHVTPFDRILDVGCGNGALTNDLAHKVRLVVGIDLAQKNIDYAQKNYSADNITYICGNAVDYPFEQYFDCIVLSNVLEHIRDRVSFLQALQEIGKRFIIRVPALDRDWISLYKKEMGVEWRLDNTHYTEYTLDQLHSEFAQSGLKIAKLNIRFGEYWVVAN